MITYDIYFMYIFKKGMVIKVLVKYLCYSDLAFLLFCIPLSNHLLVSSDQHGYPEVSVSILMRFVASSYHQLSSLSLW